MAYETTTVAVEKSQGDIRRLLLEHGATSVGFGELREGDQGIAVCEFGTDERRVRMRVPYKLPDREEAEAKAKRARSKTVGQLLHDMNEQEAKRIWRVVAWNIKARLVAVEEGVETFEEAFLAHMVTSTGETVYEHIRGSTKLLNA